ncbi:MAG TPA: hypothetical protein VGR16_14935 [Thermomicrobiales bacterium]|nr:hypothetical protein [Thermomicrobiales bacterium]
MNAAYRAHCLINVRVDFLFGQTPFSNLFAHRLGLLMQPAQCPRAVAIVLLPKSPRSRLFPAPLLTHVTAPP